MKLKPESLEPGKPLPPSLFFYGRNEGLKNFLKKRLFKGKNREVVTGEELLAKQDHLFGQDLFGLQNRPRAIEVVSPYSPKLWSFLKTWNPPPSASLIFDQESQPDAAFQRKEWTSVGCVPCYDWDPGPQRYWIKKQLALSGLSLSPPVQAILTHHGDPESLDSFLDQSALLQDPSSLSPEEVASSLAPHSDHPLQDLIFQWMDQKQETLDFLTHLTPESFLGATRFLGRLMGQIIQLQSFPEITTNFANLAKSLNPPVFFKHQGWLQKSRLSFSKRDLANVGYALIKAEYYGKKGGVPWGIPFLVQAMIFCRQALGSPKNLP